eukprot:s722_g7.t1
MNGTEGVVKKKKKNNSQSHSPEMKAMAAHASTSLNLPSVEEFRKTTTAEDELKVFEGKHVHKVHRQESRLEQLGDPCAKHNADFDILSHAMAELIRKEYPELLDTESVQAEANGFDCTSAADSRLSKLRLNQDELEKEKALPPESYQTNEQTLQPTGSGVGGQYDVTQQLTPPTLIDPATTPSFPSHSDANLGDESLFGAMGPVNMDELFGGTTLDDPPEGTQVACASTASPSPSATSPTLSELRWVKTVKGLSHQKQTVMTMNDNFAFFRQAVEEVCTVGEPVSSEYRSSFKLDPAVDFISPEELKSRFGQFSMSTSYSGVGAPEATMHVLRHTMVDMFGPDVPMPKVLFQCEYDEHCRAELFRYAQLPGGSDACVFGDLCEFFVDSIKDTITELKARPELAFEVLAKMVATGEAVKTHAYCHKHKKICFATFGCFQTMAFVHTAGTSCIAYAPNGNMKGVRDVSILPFLAWIGLRIKLQEPILLHENSKRFPVSIMQRLLGHIYHIDDTDVDALVYGGVVRRERKLTRFVHREKAFYVCKAKFADFNARFYRESLMHWREYYWQHLMDNPDAKEFLKCLVRAARERAAADQPAEPAEPDANAAIQKAEEIKNPYEAALTDFERKSLQAYRQNWPGMAYSLTQNGATGFAMHSSPDCMHTLIRNLGLVWSDVLSSGQW